MKITHHPLVALGLLFALSGCGEPAAPDATPEPEAPSEAASAAPVDSADAPSASVAALQDALAEPDPYARAKRLAELVPTLGDAELPFIREALKRFRAGIGVVEFDLLLRHWAARRPEESARWAVDASPRLYRLGAIRTAFEALARVDPEKVPPLILQAYAQDAEQGAVGQFSLVSGWFERDREAVEEYVKNLDHRVSRQRALLSYTTILAASDGSDALFQWAEALPEDKTGFRHEAFIQTIGALHWVDPDAAVRFCEAHCEGNSGWGLRNVLVRKRLREGMPGGEVLDWVARTAKAETGKQRRKRDKTLLMGYAQWAFRDHQAAVAWMEEELAQPEQKPWLKLLYNEYAQQIAAADPERALAFAEQVEDENDRTLTMVRIARLWRMRDEAAAEAWLAESPLDERQREQARDPSLPHYLPRAGVSDPTGGLPTS